MSLFHRHTDYSIEQGNIRYMDGSSLLRPMDMPRSQQIIMAVFVVIAVIIGVRLAAGAIAAVNDSNTQSKASVEENLSRTVSYNLPVLTQMADMDDQAILDSLAAAGYTVYNQTAEGTAGLDLVKLPDDVTVTDAATPARRTTAAADAIIFVFFFDFFSELILFPPSFFHLHLIFVLGSVFHCTADSIIAHYQMSLYRFL